jgi:hypothetical protein
MWIQDQSKERFRPPALPHDIVMVNSRGRVVGATVAEAKGLIGQGFRYAPKGSKVGDYVPVFDRGEKWANEDQQAPDIKEKTSPDVLEVVEI